MANSYSAPNFNIDTSTPSLVAVMTALKGSAPAATDLLYVAGGATVTIESDLSILKIINGHYSTGAAVAGGRYAVINIAAGITIQYGGSPTYTSSGYLCNPTSADTSSKLARLNYNGTPSQLITVTNRGDAFSASQEWTHTVAYGSVLGTGYTHFKHATYLFNGLNNTTNRTTATEQVLDNCITTSFQYTEYGADNGAPTSCIPKRFRHWYHYIGQSGVGGTASYMGLRLGQIANQISTAGALYDYSGWGYERAPGSTATSITFTPISIVQGPITPVYGGTEIGVAAADIRPTQTVPGKPTIANPGFSRTLSITLDLSAYALTDFFEVATAAGVMVARFSKQRYVDQGNIAYTTPVLTNGTEYQLKVRASSDNYNFSDWSALSDAATPTLAATDTAFSTLEQTRNTLTTHDVADVALGETWLHLGETLTGTLSNIPKPSTPTGVRAVAISSTAIELSCDIVSTATGIKWYSCSNAAGDNPVLITPTFVREMTWRISSLSAGSEYHFKAKATNGTGDSASYSAVVSESTMSASPILTRMETNMVNLMESMTRASGYWFDWPSADEKDLAKAGILTDGTQAAARISLDPLEDAVPPEEQADSSAYHNVVKAKIESVSYLSALSDNPGNSVKVLYAKMIEDQKKLFGVNGTATAEHVAFWNDVAVMEYKGSSVEPFENGDAACPGKLITNWEISYTQLRTNPSISAN